MPQAVQTETQAKQQGLAHLHRQAAAGCTSREGHKIGHSRETSG